MIRTEMRRAFRSKAFLAVLAPFGFCLFTAAVLAVYFLHKLNAFYLVVFGHGAGLGIVGNTCYLLFLLLLGLGLFIGGDRYAEKA